LHNREDQRTVAFGCRVNNLLINDDTLLPKDKTAKKKIALYFKNKLHVVKIGGGRRDYYENSIRMRDLRKNGQPYSEKVFKDFFNWSNCNNIMVSYQISDLHETCALIT